MIERILENWLDNTTEREFQVPFCQMLLNRGHRVVHMTRHCGMELGKDVLSIDPDGTPCAFQLKTARSGRIGLSQWQSEISHQVDDLVCGAIVHPAVPSTGRHRSFIVTNGELVEEVARAIDDRNRKWAGEGHVDRKLEVIVRADFLRDLSELGAAFWPPGLVDIERMLRFYLEPGEGYLNKSEFAALMESHLGLEDDTKVTSSADALRRMAGGAVLCSLLTSKFTTTRNHYSEIEAWTMYSAAVLGSATRWNIEYRHWKDSWIIAQTVIHHRMSDLAEEATSAQHLIEGNPQTDYPFIPIRTTILKGLLSITGLRLRLGDPDATELLDKIRRFCLDASHQPLPWGESSIPHFIAWYWMLRACGESKMAETVLLEIASLVVSSNQPGSEAPLPNPYVGFEELAEAAILHEKRFAKEESYDGASFLMESLIHLMARRNLKQSCKEIWPRATKIRVSAFEWQEPWHYFRWLNEDAGSTIDHEFEWTKNWDDLVREASEDSGSQFTQYLHEDPTFWILFLTVYPHRAVSGAVRTLDRLIADTSRA